MHILTNNIAISLLSWDMRTSSLTWSPIPNNSLQLLNAELRLANSQIRIERYIKRMLLHIYNVRLVFYHRLGNVDQLCP